MEGFKKRNILEQSCLVLSPAWHLCSGRAQAPSWGQPAGGAESGCGCGLGHSSRWGGGEVHWTVHLHCNRQRENWVSHFQTSPSAQFMAYSHILKHKTGKRERYDCMSLKRTNKTHLECEISFSQKS